MPRRGVCAPRGRRGDIASRRRPRGRKARRARHAVSTRARRGTRARNRGGSAHRRRSFPGGTWWGRPACRDPRRTVGRRTRSRRHIRRGGRGRCSRRRSRPRRSRRKRSQWRAGPARRRARDTPMGSSSSLPCRTRARCRHRSCDPPRRRSVRRRQESVRHRAAAMAAVCDGYRRVRLSVWQTTQPPASGPRRRSARRARRAGSPRKRAPRRRTPERLGSRPSGRRAGPRWPPRRRTVVATAGDRTRSRC